MSYRTIDGERCLQRYKKGTCTRCETICPQEAIRPPHIDPERCDDCGLCTAVCPMGAIRTQIDYETELTRIQEMEEPMLQCTKASSSGFPCLGVLTRHILWELGMRRELRIACAPCHSCRPAVAKWLSQEITACNEVLSLCGKSSVLCVQAGDVKKEQTVSRRSFFRALLQTVGQEVKAVAKREAGTGDSFFTQHWLANHGEHLPTASRILLSGIEVTNSCDGCRLCEKLCPHNALHFDLSEGESILTFRAERCTSCGLCAGNCPQQALTLCSCFDGRRTFTIKKNVKAETTCAEENHFFMQRG